MAMEKRRYTEIGHRLAEIMGSQEELAKALGIQQSAVSKKLRGELHVTVVDLEKIARYINMPMTIFFDRRGTDGDVLRTFHEMHLRAPVAIDQIVNAYRHNRRLLKQLGEIAAQLVKETPKELRRRDLIRSAGVADSDVGIPASFNTEEGDEGTDDSPAHHGVGPEPGGDSAALGRAEDQVEHSASAGGPGILDRLVREVHEQAGHDGSRAGDEAEPQVGDDDSR